MKLDKIKFAVLIAHIQYWISRGHLLSLSDIDDIDFMIDVNIPEPTFHTPSTSDISELMRHMAQGTNKIDAIRLHRKLTGWGLKESKEEVEKHWVSKLPDLTPKSADNATLDDILRNA